MSRWSPELAGGRHLYVFRSRVQWKDEVKRKMGFELAPGMPVEFEGCLSSHWPE